MARRKGQMMEGGMDEGKTGACKEKSGTDEEIGSIHQEKME